MSTDNKESLVKVKHRGDGVLEHYHFNPSDEQQRTKAKLLSAVQDKRVSGRTVALLDVDELARVTRSPKIKHWAKEPGFLSWLTDTDEPRNQLTFLRDKAMKQMELVLEDPDPKSASAKVALFKILVQQAPPESVKEDGELDLAKLVAENLGLIKSLVAEAEKPARLPPATKEVPDV